MFGLNGLEMYNMLMQSFGAGGSGYNGGQQQGGWTGAYGGGSQNQLAQSSPWHSWGVPNYLSMMTDNLYGQKPSQPMTASGGAPQALGQPPSANTSQQPMFRPTTEASNMINPTPPRMFDPGPSTPTPPQMFDPGPQSSLLGVNAVGKTGLPSMNIQSQAYQGAGPGGWYSPQVPLDHFNSMNMNMAGI